MTKIFMFIAVYLAFFCLDIDTIHAQDEQSGLDEIKKQIKELKKNNEKKDEIIEEL